MENVLTDHQAAVLNEAIDIADALDRSIQGQAESGRLTRSRDYFVLGKLQQAAEDLSSAAFELLNTADNLAGDAAAKAAMDGRRRRRRLERGR
jgi:hypothetical protein